MVVLIVSIGVLSEKDRSFIVFVFFCYEFCVRYIVGVSEEREVFGSEF